jgi:hypothetical protein
MIRLLRRLWPSFLHRLDHKLLIHQPALWATRFHLLLAAWLVMALLIVVRAFTSPLDKLPDWVAMMGGLSLLAGLAWLVWLVSMYRFRPGRHPFSEQSGLKQLMVVLSGLLLLSSLPFVYGVSLGARHDLGNIGKEQEVEKRQELVEQSSLYFSYDGYQLERDKSRYGYATSLSILDASWLPNLQQAMEAFEDYGGDLEGRSAQSLWEDAQASRLAFSSDFRQDWEEVRVNMNRHSEAFRQYQETDELAELQEPQQIRSCVYLFALVGRNGWGSLDANQCQTVFPGHAELGWLGNPRLCFDIYSRNDLTICGIRGLCICAGSTLLPSGGELGFRPWEKVHGTS